MEKSDEIRYRIGSKEIYEKRKETIERNFGTAKEHHAMRYTQQIGREKMAMKVGLTFACLNMKKLAKILCKARPDTPKKSAFFIILKGKIEKMKMKPSSVKIRKLWTIPLLLAQPTSVCGSAGGIMTPDL